MVFPKKESTRDSYGQALLDLGKENRDVVVLDSDLSFSTRTGWFGRAFPERFFNCGVAEQNMITMAAGLAACGKIVFASSFAVFGTERAYNQIKQSVAYTGLNVKIVVSHSGITVGEDGASHHMPFDIAIMRVLPKMTVISPCDAIETYIAVKAAAKYVGPIYIRLSRPSTPLIFEEDYRYRNKKLNFQIGKAVSLRDGRDATVLATGIMVSVALEAAEKLTLEGIDVGVIDVHTIKPIDREMILSVAKNSGAIVTAEEHSIIGGLGGAVSEVIVSNMPIPIEMVGIKDVFTLSGSPTELMEKYGLTPNQISIAVKKVIKRKR
ncbi:MAG: transketolase family protein [Candidatus Bathyarchaeota archaeon]